MRIIKIIRIEVIGVIKIIKMLYNCDKGNLYKLIC